MPMSAQQYSASPKAQLRAACRAALIAFTLLTTHVPAGRPQALVHIYTTYKCIVIACSTCRENMYY